jgi:hypothetical protein
MSHKSPKRHMTTISQGTLFLIVGLVAVAVILLIVGIIFIIASTRGSFVPEYG